MNTFNLIGRVVGAPKFFTNADKSQTAVFTLAVNRDYKNADGSVTADFINLQGFVPADKTANNRFTYLEKGMLISCSGSIRSYVSEKNGVKNYGMSMTVSNISFLESKQVVESRRTNTVNA